jgi:hypothetical protein
MDRIRDDVEHQLARFDGHGSMPRIVSAWTAAVGEEVARNAWPARIARDGTLRVHTSSSVWAFELTQLAPRILERLVAELGEQAPSGIRFAQGHLPETPTPPPPASRRETPVSPALLAEARSLAASIDGAELRERVARAAALGLARAAAGRWF